MESSLEKAVQRQVGLLVGTKIDVSVGKYPKASPQAHVLTSTACFLVLYPITLGSTPGLSLKSLSLVIWSEV